MSLATFIASMILAGALGTRNGSSYGCIVMGIGVFATGIAYQIERFLKRKGWA